MTNELTTPGGYDYAALDSETRIVAQQRAGEIKTLMRRAAQDIIDIGSKLIEVKERLPHGQFGKWLEVEFAWSQDTAHRFMAVARHIPEIPHGAEFDAKALYLLAAPSTPEEARQEALERADQGERVSTKEAKRIIEKHKQSDPPPPPPTSTSVPADHHQRTKERYGISVSPEQPDDAGLDQDTLDQLASHAIKYHGSVSTDGGETWLHRLVDDDGNEGEYTDRQVEAWLHRLWADTTPPVRNDYTLPETPPPFLQPPTTQPRQRIERALDEDTIDRLDACGVAYINSMSEDDGRTWQHQVIDADANPRIFTAMGLMAWLEDLERGMVLLPAQDLLLVEDGDDQQEQEPATRLPATGPAALQMQVAALEGERDQYKEQADKHFRETERLWSEIANLDTELRDVRRNLDTARAALEAERQRADGLENEADQLGSERNEAHAERDTLRQQLAQVCASQPAWVPQTVDEALDTDGLLVELLRQVGDAPVSLLSLVKRLTTTREMLSHSLARCAHLWERLGLLLGDATPGTGGRGLWVPMEGATGYTFGTIKREERADLYVPMADSHSNVAGHGGRPPDTSLRDRVRALLAEHPDWTQQQIADAAGCGISLVKAVKARRK